jgi:hypothetical protein
MASAPLLSLLLLLLSCSQHKPLPEVLTESLTHHLQQIDSSATLDSIHILWSIRVTQRLGRVIDDSIYMREFVRVQGQLAAAQLKNDKDSIEFYQYEANYMKKETDSITQSIAQGDTTRQWGRLLGCAYYLTKNRQKKMDSTYIFIDSTATMRFTDLMDAALKHTVATMN